MDEIKKETDLEVAHGLVHEICFNLSKGNDCKAKEQLLELDLLLHEAIHNESEFKNQL